MQERKMVEFLEQAAADSEPPKADPTKQGAGCSPEDMGAFMEFAAREGRRTLDTFKDVLLVNHFDTDGLASGSIAALALRGKSIPFKILTVKKMTEDVLKTVRSDSAKYIIFVDIGTGFLQQINEIANSGKSILQIDHHAPETVARKSDALSIINCHNFNIDGAFYLCSSSAAYFTFAENSSVETAKRMAQLAIVGAVGDIQDVKGLRGLNRELLEQAQKLKIVKVMQDLRLFGRVSRNLVNFLNFCNEPFLPTLTGNPKHCALFLKKHGIPLWRETEGKRTWLRYYDLTPEERMLFRGALINFCFEKKLAPDAVKSIIGEVYLFPFENPTLETYDAHEFSSLLNACGRSAKAEIGIRLCMNEGDAYGGAHNLLIQHRIEISKAIMYAKRHAEDFGAFYFLDGRNEIPDSIIGTVAGSYFNSGLIERGKPVIALSIDENAEIKASSRGWSGLVEKGLDLREMMHLSSKEAGGFGGGHSVAAGASFPNTEEALAKFLLKAKKTIKQQIGL